MKKSSSQSRWMSWTVKTMERVSERQRMQDEVWDQMHVRHSRGGKTKARDGLEICGLKRRTERSNKYKGSEGGHESQSRVYDSERVGVQGVSGQWGVTISTSRRSAWFRPEHSPAAMARRTWRRWRRSDRTGRERDERLAWTKVQMHLANLGLITESSPSCTKRIVLWNQNHYDSIPWDLYSKDSSEAHSRFWPANRRGDPGSTCCTWRRKSQSSPQL